MLSIGTEQPFNCGKHSSFAITYTHERLTQNGMKLKQCRSAHSTRRPCPHVTSISNRIVRIAMNFSLSAVCSLRVLLILKTNFFCFFHPFRCRNWIDESRSFVVWLLATPNRSMYGPAYIVEIATHKYVWEFFARTTMRCRAEEREGKKNF